MKILHSGTLNPHTHSQTFIYKAQRLTNLSTLAHIIDMLFFISMTLFRFLKFEIAFLHFLFNLVFNWQKRHDSKASTYLNTIPLYPIVWRQRGPGMSTDDKSIHPSQTRVPDMKRGVRSPGMSTARGNLRFVEPFPTAKLPSYHGMLSEDKLSHQFPIKQILATNSITTMRRTNYSSRTMSTLAHFCPIIVYLFVQPAGWGREGAKYESLHILVAILILSSWSPLVLFQKFRLIVYIILDAIPLKVTLIPPWWPPDTCPFPDKISSRSS